MAGPAATTFSAALEKHPLRTFQVITFIICMVVLTCDGMDAQLLGIVAPRVIADFGVDRGTFGVAMSAALVGFGIGSWGGGWLGDTVGRRYALAIATVVFSLGTVAASQTSGVWDMAAWRLLGGLGFGAAYANAIALAGEWLPSRWRSVAVTTLSVGTPAGGTVVGWIAPGLVVAYGWRDTFVIFGVATFLVVVLILATLRDSPLFLMARGQHDKAEAGAAKLFGEAVALLPEAQDATGARGEKIGVLHHSNFRLNLGVGIAFTASTTCAYGILNWSTTFLTAKGFTLAQAGNAVSIGGLTSIAASILAGLLVQRFGSKRVMATISASLFVSMIALAAAVESLIGVPDDNARLLVILLLGVTAAIFSAGIASFYAMLTHGYPPSCRSAGIGFGIFMGRVGAILASGFGGTLLDLGQGSVIPFFVVMCVAAVAVSAGAFVVDKHVPPARAAA